MCFAEMLASQPPSREPAGSDRLPVHRSESPTGYSSAGCSPAEPASALPVTDHCSSISSREGIKCAAQPHCKDAARPRPHLALMPCRARCIRRQRQCHLYFARPVSFLSCADMHLKDSHRDRRVLPLCRSRAADEASDTEKIRAEAGADKSRCLPTQH